MFSTIRKKNPPFFLLLLSLMMLFALSACDSTPPKLMKASKQFDTDERRDNHVAYMRKNHMDILLHKRDKTMYEGIRTEKGSLKACINCHVPEKHNGEVLRHTNPEHFCSTCHGYVAQQLDCFQCHVDHPVSQNKTTSTSINPHANNPHVMRLEKPGIPADVKIVEVHKIEDSIDLSLAHDVSLAQSKSVKSIGQVVSGGTASE